MQRLILGATFGNDATAAPPMTRRLLLPGLVVLAFYYALFGGEYSALEVRRAHDEYAQTEQQLATVRSEIDMLRARADSLESDPIVLERIAREKFGMIRDGEILYRVVPAQDPETLDEAGEA